MTNATAMILNSLNPFGDQVTTTELAANVLIVEQPATKPAKKPRAKKAA